MGRKQDDNVEHADPAEPPGRVEVDSRGHNVWRWTREANDSTSVVLKRLDNQDLALEPTQKVPIAPAKGKAAPKGMAANGAPTKGAPAKRVPATSRKSTDAAGTKGGVFHPALQPDDGCDSGGGFDPYNSR